MNNGGYFSKNATIAALLWFAVAALITAAWLVGLLTDGHLHVAGLLAATGCALSALAAVLHIRTYACRLVRMVRVSSGLDSGDAEIRPLR